MKEKVISVLKGAVIAAVGAALTYLSELGTGQDFGSWTPILVAAFSVLANAFRKAVT